MNAMLSNYQKGAVIAALSTASLWLDAIAAMNAVFSNFQERAVSVGSGIVLLSHVRFPYLCLFS